MKNLTFQNKETSINATIDNGSIVFENGKEYHINARYSANGIAGAYITYNGLTYSLKDFSTVANEITAFIISQPKKERKTDGGAVKAKNLVKLASASVERLTVLLADALLKRRDDLIAYGADENKVNDATLNVHKYYVNADYRTKVDETVRAESEAAKAKEDAERAERERRAKEAASDRIVAGIMVAYGVNRATAEAMAHALSTVHIEQPQA